MKNNNSTRQYVDLLYRNTDEELRRKTHNGDPKGGVVCSGYEKDSGEGGEYMKGVPI